MKNNRNRSRNPLKARFLPDFEGISEVFKPGFCPENQLHLQRFH
jgi:hypothetical protein